MLDFCRNILAEYDCIAIGVDHPRLKEQEMKLRG